MRRENHALRGEVYNITSKVDEDSLGCIAEVVSTLDTYSSHSAHHAVLAFMRQLVFLKLTKCTCEPLLQILSYYDKGLLA